MLCSPSKALVSCTLLKSNNWAQESKPIFCIPTLFMEPNKVIQMFVFLSSVKVVFCCLSFQNNGRWNTFAGNTFCSFSVFFSFMIMTAIDPYKIETMSILLIKLLSLLKKLPPSQLIVTDSSCVQLCWNNYEVCILWRSQLTATQIIPYRVSRYHTTYF